MILVAIVAFPCWINKMLRWSGDEDVVQLPPFQFAIDAGRHEQRIDRDNDRRFGRREDTKAQSDDDDGGQHQPPGGSSPRIFGSAPLIFLVKTI
jgi:hypothetical protein